jgi:hypothetical protein
MGRVPGRVSMTVAAVALAAAACSGPAPPVAPLDPFASPPPANIVDELVRNTVETTGLAEPYDVIDIREGPLDELRGLTPEAQAAASIVPYATGRRSLDRRAWRVRIVGSDGSAACVGDPCARPRVYVEAYLDATSHSVIAVVVGPVPAELQSPAP